MYSNFNFTSDWSDAVYAKRNNIVFENKNKAYGAFVLRNNYERNVLFAFLSSFFIFASLIFIPMLFHHSIVLPPIVPPIKGDPTVIIDPPSIKIEPPICDLHPPVIHSTGAVLDLSHLQTTNNNDDDTMAALPPINPNNSNNHNTGSGCEVPHHEVIHVVTPPISDPNKILLGAQEMPEFIGGEKELYKYLDGEMHYPQYSRENNIQGIVYMSFVINQDGSPGDIKILRGVDNFLNAEAIRVLKKMPKWKPGKQNGNPVRVQMSLPVKFEIRGN